MGNLYGYAWALARFLQGILLSVFAFALIATDSVAADPSNCRFDGLAGQEIWLIRDGREEIARMETSVLVNDVVRTGHNSRAEIICDNGVRVTVGSQSRLNLGNLPVAADDHIVVRVLSGIAGFIAPERRWQSFRVYGSSAIASVRSTEWLVDVSAVGTAIFVREGAVAVQQPTEQSDELVDLTTLAPGEGIDVTFEGATGGVKTWGKPRVDKSFQRLGLTWSR